MAKSDYAEFVGNARKALTRGAAQDAQTWALLAQAEQMRLANQIELKKLAFQEGER